MLEIICNTALYKNTCFKKNSNIFHAVHEKNLSQSIFNELNKYLIRKEMEFNNVCTEEKKDNDKYVICTNFVINNLLNILNKKDMNLNSNEFYSKKNNKTQKKKIKNINNILFESNNFSKKITNLKQDGNLEKIKIFKPEKLANKITKKQNQFLKTDELNSINKVTNFFDLKELNNHFLKKNINIFDRNKYSINIKDEKKMVSPKNVKNAKNSLFLFKKINKINNLINEKSLFKELDKKERVKLYSEPLILNNSKNSIEWKKLISQKILLSIFNKKNQAEIHLKPEYLGSIYIRINMKKNKAILNFISTHNEVRLFLDNHIPFLRSSLIKNGIKLEQCNIFSSFQNKKIKKFTDLLDKNIFNSRKLKIILDARQKDIEKIKCKEIDVYI